jgi:hypothetical protein
MPSLIRNSVILGILLIIAEIGAMGQNVRFGPYEIPSVSSQYPPLLQGNLPPNSPVLSVCHSPANAVPCSNYATTYQGNGSACPNGAQDTPDPNATTSSCQATGDSLGNVAWWAPSGTYDMTVCIGSTCSLYTVSQGGAGSSGGVTGVTAGGGLQLGNANTSVGLITTCTTAQILEFNGTSWACATLSGGGNVSTTPAASQNIVQPSGTQFSTNNLSNIIYTTPADNWSQNPSGSLSVGANTVTLSPCPRGLTSNTFRHSPTYVYISGVGTPEAVLLTATTCTVGGGSTGTITFTAANTHGSGFAIGSASGGLQETINVAPVVSSFDPVSKNGPGSLVIPPNQYTLQARVTIVSPFLKLDFAGSVVTCAMADSCLVVGDSTDANYVSDVTIRNFTGQAACNNCNYPMIEDTGQSVRFVDIAVANPNPVGSTSSGSSFGSLIQVDNDQSAVIDHLDVIGGRWGHCDTTFCSAAILGKGGSGNSGIMYISHTNLDLGCSANGVDNQNANTLRISDSVIESQAQFGVRSNGVFSNVPNVELDNSYFEVAGCSASGNPLGIGQAGLIVENGFASIKNSVGPVGSAPLYANTGSTQYNYYIVAHCSGGSCGGGLVSPPYLAGIALTNGTGSIPVKWPQFGTTGTITYDVLRTSGAANTPAPYTAVCGGGSTTACGSVATALSVGSACSTVGTANLCTFSDTASASTTSYTVTAIPTYFPALGNGTGAGIFWPGSVILTAVADSVGSSPSPSGAHFDRFGDNVAPTTTNPVSQVVSSYPLIPRYFAQQCVSTPGGAWVSCVENSNGSSAAPGATLLNEGYNGAAVSGLKGRINIEQGLAFNGAINGSHKITLVDSNGAKTVATPGMRPTWDANDTFIGLDNGAATSPSSAQLSFGAPVSISNYIGNVGDNASYLERLTASLKTFTVPITTNSQVTSTLATGTAPFVIASTTPVGNLTLSAHPQVYEAGVLTATEKIYTNTQALTTGAATHTLANSFTFTSSSTFGCTCTDQTAANACKAVPASATTVTLAGTGSDTLWLSCSGH